MEEYISLIEYLKGWFAAYKNLLIDEEELAKETSSMMEENTAKFIAFNQGRKDNKLSITALDKELQQEMEYFLLRDKTRFSGMDIDKGYFNEVDALHLIVERWVRIYIQFLNSSKEITEEDKKEEPQQGKVLEAVDDDIVLPSGLDNDEAKELFKRAIKAGLMEKVDGGFKWKKAKWSLSYFAELVSDKFKLGKGEYNGKPRKSWKPFEVIFGIKELGKRKNDYHKGGNLPSDYKLIDSLFEE